MKRVKESGASYRNKRRAKLENIRANEGALLKYVKSVIPETSDSSLGLNSSQTTSNSEQAEKIQELDTVPKDQIPTTSTALVSPSVCPDMDMHSSETEIDTTSALSLIQYQNFDDIGKWPEHIDDNIRLHLIQQGQEIIQHIDTNFAEMSTVTRSDSCSLKSKGETRRLTKEWFYRTLTNGEKVLRTWMAYSPSKASLFCFCCRLFENVNTPNGSKFCSSDGFNTWWKLNPKVSSHESSALHIQNYCKWKELESRLQKGQTIDKKEQDIVAKEIKKWQEILIRMFDIIRFLAKQNLALRGHIENDTSTNRGNFLELVNLIAKYDPVLREHLVRSKMCGKISITYMSPQIQNEFIAILGDNVRQHIIGQIKKAKYYAIIFDSTPDLSHKDQTSQVLRYVVIENQEVKVMESFIDFIETKDKTAEGISKMILDKIQADGLDISNCRGQAYDNAAVMAGKYSGVQQRIQEINPKAEFVPCSNHSLNLVCLHAASVEVDSVTFFGTLERCYSFFSSSTHRWEVLIAATGKSLKRVQDTRWSARGDAVNMTWHHYKDILVTLEKLTEAGESLNTRTDAGALLVSMQSFSFLCFLGLWQPVLHEVNDAQKYLQTRGLDIRLCAQKVNALQMILTEKREEWANGAVGYAKDMCEELGISIKPLRRITRKHIFDDGTRDVNLSCENELRRKLFSSLDRVIVEIRERFQQLQNLTDKFAYLTPAILLDPDNTECNLDYASDEIDEQDFKLERLRLRTFVAATGNENKLINADSLELFKFIIKSKLEDTLPNILIMFRIFFTIAISNASCERSFSKLKLIKNYLRSTMSTLRLTNLAILSIEQEVCDAIDIDGAIKDFALKKSRRINF
nr:unnamed protein product [Amyelois transitella]